MLVFKKLLSVFLSLLIIFFQGLLFPTLSVFRATPALAVVETVTNVTATTADGSYKAGQTIAVTITFSNSVTVTGTPQLELETGATNRFADYASGSPGTTLTFNYLIQAGDTAADLDYFATNSLTLNGGTIVDTVAGDAADLTLPAVGGAGSLGANKALVVDTTAPIVAEVTPVTTPTADNTPNYIFSTDEAGTISYGGDCSSATTSASMGNNTITFNALTDGAHSNCTVTVIDVAGNASNTQAVTTFTVDATPPNTSLAAYSPDPSNDNTPTYSGTATDAISNVTSVEYQIDGGGWNVATASDGTFNSTSEGFTFTTGALTDATHTIETRATDALSNVETSLGSDSLTVDTTAPVLNTFTSTTGNGAYGASSTINITATYNEAAQSGSTATVVLDTSDSILLDQISGNNISGIYTVGAGDTSADLTISSVTSQNVTDVAGNAQTGTTIPMGQNLSDNKNIVVDTTNPSGPTGVGSTSHITSTWSTDPTIDMSWTSATDTNLSGYSYLFDTSSGTTPDNSTELNNAATTVTSGSLSDGNSHYFHIKALDTATNAGMTVEVGPFYVDTAAPSVPGTPSTTNPTNDTTPTWGWTASSDGGSGLHGSTPYTVEWSQDNTFGSGVSISTVGTNSFTHSSVLAEGTWYFRAKANDALNQSSAFSSNGTVVIDITAPNAPTITTPIMTDDKINNSEKAAIVIAGTAEANSFVTVVISDGTNSVSGSQQLTGGGTSYSITLDGTAASPASLLDGSLTVTVTARDAASNTSLSPSSPSLNQDSVAPTLAQVTAVSTPTNDTTPAYQFSSNESGSITYGGSCADDDVSTAAMGTNSVEFNVLSAGTYSSCTIRVTDSSGNQSSLLSVNSFVVDLAAPTLDSAQTKTTTTIDVTFNESINISSVNTDGSDFTVASNTVTAAAVSGAVVTLTLGTPIGTAAIPAVNLVNTAGGVSDLAGNALMSAGPTTPTDGIVPVLQSARTFSTTQIDLTFSEDLNGSSDAITDFGVNDFTISSTDEVSNGVVRLTLSAAFGTAQTPIISYFTSGNGVQDLDGNVAPAVSSMTPSDGVSPSLVSAQTASINTISVAFSEALNSGSISPSDFSVVSPTNTVSGVSISGDTVTLTLGTANTTSATPSVILSGDGVTDTSANTQTSGSATASDGVGPGVTNVTSSTTDGTYASGQSITITVSLSEAATVVTSGGTPRLLLETGTTDRYATYASGSGSTTLTFSYTIQEGDSSSDLDYNSTTSLELNGGTINDSLGNAAVLTLASPGATGSLGANKALVISGSSVPLAPSTTVSSSTPQVTVNDIGADVTITVPSGVTNSTLDLTNIDSVSGSDRQATIPDDYTVNVTTSLGVVSMQIPEDTVITGGSGAWNGVVNVPQIRSNSSVSLGDPTTFGVQAVIEVGFGDVPLTLSKAVRLVIPGQAGRSAGYIRSGAFTGIGALCSADSQAAGDALATGSDCKIDSGADLVIWTKHFTQFVAFTNTPLSGPGASEHCTDSKPGSAPTLLSAVASGANSVTLSWSDKSDNSTYYVITYGLESGKQQYGNPNVGGKGSTSYTVSGLSGGTTYYFRVRNGSGCATGDYSGELAATPGGAVISGPAAGFSAGVLGAKTQIKYGADGKVLGEEAVEGETQIQGSEDLVIPPIPKASQGQVVGGLVGGILMFIGNIFSFLGSIFR